jgi:lipopolysaccharide transport system ATP-binding protein
MDHDVAIRIDGLGKCYRLGEERPLAALLRGLRGRAHPEELWALRDVGFDVARGEAIGIVGRNGAGKSTLLKILARITEPTTGSALIHGRVGSLLEVGTGFHPELTGRENVFLNGAILGLRRAEIAARFEEIVEFAGVGRFLDTPVKRYSSGMRVRLAFSVAAHVEPEILIVDEVLAVGDAEFQSRCLGKMSDVAGHGRTVLFVSHNLAALRALCSRAVWLDDGRVAGVGAVGPVVDAYLARRHHQAETPVGERRDRGGSGALRFTRVELRAGAARRVGTAPCSGAPLSIALGYAAASAAPLKNVRFAVLVLDALGSRVFATDTRLVNADCAELPPAGELVCDIPDLPLAAGRYRLDLWAALGDEVADHVEDAASLVVEEGDVFGTGRATLAEKHGPCVVRHAWSLAEGPDDVAAARSVAATALAERALGGADAGDAGRCFIKPGYRECATPRSFDREPDARYWTEERLAAARVWQHPVYRLCRDLLCERGAQSFLDVGSGPGAKVAELIAPLCSDLVLIDQPSCHEIVARELPAARFVAADLDALDLDLGRGFDLVVCADVLEHLKHPAGCVDFVRAHLSDGGRAVISTPERDRLRGRECTESPHPEHVREWNAAEFRAFLEHCGLEVERQLLLPPGRTGAAERLASRLLGRFVPLRRWTACQAAICRRKGSR